MKFLKLRLLLIAAVGFAFSGTANAQTTQNIDVSATVPTVCIVDTGTTETAMAFDLTLLASAAGPFTMTTNLAWRCNIGSAPVISIGPGGSTDQLNREMDSGSNTLAYNLYTDALFGTIWGDGLAGTATVGITPLGMGIAGNTVVNGRVLLADALAAPVGAYLDTVVVTVIP